MGKTNRLTSISNRLTLYFTFSLNFHSISTQCLFHLKGVYLNYGETLSGLPAAIAVEPNKYIERQDNVFDR